MPNRIIKESVCTSKNLDNLTAEEEVFFYRLMVNSDDFGRFESDPELLRARCFPRRTGKITIEQMSKWITSLQNNDLVFIYEVDGTLYGQFTTWDKHQQKRAKHSKYPDPPDDYHLYEHVLSNDIIRNQMPANVPEKRETRSEKREARSENPALQKSKKKYADFVTMTESEYRKLVDQFGEAGVKDRIENLNLYKGSKGVKYASDYLTILAWDRRDRASPKNTQTDKLSRIISELEAEENGPEAGGYDHSQDISHIPDI